MILKATIVVLFIAVVLSLSSALVFLLKDFGATESKRTLYALGIRIALAAALMGVIGYGFYSGKLQSTAPWDRSLRAVPTANG